MYADCLRVRGGGKNDITSKEVDGPEQYINNNMYCSATTQKGTRCKYKATGDNGKCTRHSKSNSAIAACVTVTFGDVAENHVGMQQIGSKCTSGFSVDLLRHAKKKFEHKGLACELVELGGGGPPGSEEAALLVVRGALSKAKADAMLAEQVALKWDTKAIFRGKVKNKLARHNLCYSDFSQTADHENGKGTVINFANVPELAQLRASLPGMLGYKSENLQAEGNLYYDPSKCGIGWHGDSERRLVVAVRLGASMPLVYQWFHNSVPVGPITRVVLNHGDVYVMSDKATGYDWKRRSIATLRHAAGCDKYTKGK